MPKVTDATQAAMTELHTRATGEWFIVYRDRAPQGAEPAWVEEERFFQSKRCKKPQHDAMSYAQKISQHNRCRCRVDQVDWSIIDDPTALIVKWKRRIDRVQTIASCNGQPQEVSKR